MQNKVVLVTGAAGFIGFHLCIKLLNEGFKVVGVDNLNSYYEVSLKKARLKNINNISLNKKSDWNFLQADLIDKKNISEIFESYSPNIVVHLAAQAGVRYSIDNPSEYINANIVGFSNILECCRNNKIKNLLYASSSSVYGGNTKIPFSENDSVDHPVSLYAATKRSNELLAHSYSHLYDLPCIGLRFFTVFGPWGRPDMAPMKFTKAILSDNPIKIYNHGEMSRSFTYIDDAIEIVYKLLKKPAIHNSKFDTSNPLPNTSWSPYKIFNIGNSVSIKLMDFINLIENELGKKAIREFQQMQMGDVKNTASDNFLLSKYIGNLPKTDIKDGIKNFINWYKDYY